MESDKVQTTIRLTKEDKKSLKEYALKHDTNLQEIFESYAKSLIEKHKSEQE